MDDLSNKTRKELESEIVRLQNLIKSSKTHFPGLAVIKKVEKLSFAQDEKFRVLFNYSKEAVLIILDEKIIEFNDAAFKMFSLPKEELLNQTIKKLSIHQQPDGRTKNDWRKIEKEIAEKKQVKKILWFFNRGNQNVFQSEITIASVVFGEKHHLLLLIRDLTVNRDLEKTIKRIDTEQNFVQSGTWDIDLKNQTANWSESMMKMHQVQKNSSPPTLKEYINIFLEDPQKEQFDSLVRRAIKTGKEFTIDLKVKLPNKESKYFYLHCKTEKEDETKQKRLYGICLDITDRKRLEADLKEKKESYQLLVNNLPDGVIIYTPKKILYANKGAFAIAGSKELSLGRKLIITTFTVFY